MLTRFLYKLLYITTLNILITQRKLRGRYMAIWNHPQRWLRWNIIRSTGPVDIQLLAGIRVYQKLAVILTEIDR